MTDSATSPQPERGRFWSLRNAIWLLAFLTIALLTHTHVLLRPMQCDASLYYRYSRDWANGAQLYTERYEAKAPVVFWLYRATDSANPRLSLYLAGAVLVAFAAGELRRALAESAPHSAGAAAVLLVLWSGTLGNQHLYDAFSLPFAVLVFAWTGLAANGNMRTLHALLAGAAFATLVGTFPPAAFVAVGLLPLLFAVLRKEGCRAAMHCVLCFSAGALLVASVVVLHAVANGYWAGFLDAMAANRRYGALDRISGSEHAARWWDEITRMVSSGGPLVWVPLLLSLAVGIRTWTRMGCQAKTLLISAALWLVAAQAGTFPGGRHFTQYYTLLIGPLAVLGSLCFGLHTRAGPRASAVVLVVYTLVYIALHWATNAHYAIEYRKKSIDSERVPVQAVAWYVNHEIPPSDAVLICTWDRWAELYWQCSRPALSRHVIPFNLSETRPEFFAEWADDVLANPPMWIVADDTLLGPDVTGDVVRERAAGFGGHALNHTPSYDRLRAFVRREYRVVNGTVGCNILKRITSDTPRP